jgi:Flp pilus assembly protein TadD
VRDIVRRAARPAVPDAGELERLIMVDRAADKVAAILREEKRADSSFVLFPQQTMALYAFRFTRQNNLPFAIRLLALNAEAYPRSWSAADALGNGYRDAGDTTQAIASYERALALLADAPPPAGGSAEAGRTRQAIEEKIRRLRAR